MKSRERQSTENPEDIKKTIKKAEEATSEVRDKELRKVAFETLLKHLLATRPPSSGVKEGDVKRTRSPKVAHAKRKSGPMRWLEELIEDGFFNKPKGSKEILDELAERGHNLTLSDITDQLQQLTQNRKLRRKKQADKEGTRKVWKYSHW